jgi:hypothetical protein
MLITERKWQRWIDTTTQVCSHWRFVVPPTTIVFFASPSWLQNLFIYCLSLVVTDIYTKTRTRKWVCLCERLSYFVHYCFPHCYCLCHTLSGTICVSSRLILLVMSLLCVVKDVCLFVWNHLYIFHRFCMVLNKLNICILISALFCEKWTKCESIPLSFFGNSYHDWSYCYITDYAIGANSLMI